MTWWPDFDLPRIRLGEVVLSPVFLFALLGFGIMTYDPDYQRWWALGLIAVLGSLWLPARLNVTPSILWALGFLAYAVLSLLWSPDPGEGFDDLICMAILVTLFIGAQQVDLRPYMRTWVPCAVLIACGLLWYLPNRYGGFGNDTFVAEFLLIGMTFCLKGKARLVAITALVTLLLAVESNARWLVLLLALGYGLVWLWRKGHRYAAIFIPVVTLNLLFYFDLVHPAIILNSVMARAEIHLNTLLMIRDAPLFGHGAGSFDYTYPHYQEAHLKLFPQMGTIMQSGTVYVNAAHNEYLQVLAEYGVAGFILAGGFLWSIRTSAAWPTVAVIAVLALVGFPLENPATALLALLAIARPGKGFQLRWPMRLPALAASIGLLWLSTLGLISASYLTGTIALLGTNPLLALSSNIKAYELWPYARGPRTQLILTMTSVLRNTPHIVEPNSADKVYEISRSAGPEVPGLLLARLEYLVNAKRNEDEANGILKQMYAVTPRQLRLALGHMEK